MNDLTLAVRLKGDGSGLVGEVDGGTASFNRMGSAVDSINGRFAGARAQIAGLIGGLSALAAIRGVVNVVSEFEKLNAQLITLAGSRDAAASVFDSLQQFAATTPYQLGEVTQTWIMLKARGIDPTQDAMRGVGNVAAAMGKGIRDVTDSALQASVGNLETMRAMGFAVEIDGNKLRVTFDGVTRTIGKDAASLIAYFQEIGNTEFGSAMDEQMKTLVGAMSNMKDNADKLIVTLAKETGLTGALTKTANATANLLGSLDAKTVIGDAVLAAEALAAVMVARLTPGVLKQAGAWQTKVTATLAAIEADAAAARQALASAVAEEARTAALLAEAQVQQRLAAEVALFGPQRAAIERQLTAATVAHVAAQDALAAAQTRTSLATRVAANAGKGLLTMLGGWPGVIAGAVTAIGLYSLSSSDAEVRTKDWREELLRLQGDMKALDQYQLDKKIRDTAAEIEAMKAKLGGWGGSMFGSGMQAELNAARERVAQIKAAEAALAAYKKQREGLSETKGAPAPARDEAEIKKVIDALEMKVRVLGDAAGAEELYRLRLANASQAERDKADSLQKMLAAHDNGQVIADLAKQIDTLNLSERERFIQQQVARLSTNQTTEAYLAEVDAVKKLAGELHDRSAYDQMKINMETIKGATQNTLSAAEDAWVKFAQTGKLSMEDLANTVQAEIARIQFRMMMAPWLQQFFGQYYSSTAPAGGGSAPPPPAGGDALGGGTRLTVAPRPAMTGALRSSAAAPAGGAGGSTYVSVKNHYDFRGADPGSEARLRAYGERIARDTEARILAKISRGGSYTRQVRGG